MNNISTVYAQLDTFPVKDGWDPYVRKNADYWEDWDTQLSFASAMVDDIEFDAQNVIAFFEKPWKWKEEIEVWARTGYLPEDALALLEDTEDVE